MSFLLGSEHNIVFPKADKETYKVIDKENIDLANRLVSKGRVYKNENFDVAIKSLKEILSSLPEKLPKYEVLITFSTVNGKTIIKELSLDLFRTTHMNQGLMFLHNIKLTGDVVKANSDLPLPKVDDIMQRVKDMKILELTHTKNELKKKEQEQKEQQEKQKELDKIKTQTEVLSSRDCGNLDDNEMRGGDAVDRYLKSNNGEIDKGINLINNIGADFKATMQNKGVINTPYFHDKKTWEEKLKEQENTFLLTLEENKKLELNNAFKMLYDTGIKLKINTEKCRNAINYYHSPYEKYYDSISNYGNLGGEKPYTIESDEVYKKFSPFELYIDPDDHPRD